MGFMPAYTENGNFSLTELYYQYGNSSDIFVTE
jgi:hypothetical protein